MRRFETQIRLHKWRVDEAQKKLAQLVRLEESLRRDRVKLEEELAEEQAIAGSSVEIGMTYGAFAAHIISRRARLDQSIADIEGQVAEAREELRTVFGELKKFELAAAAAEQRARAKSGRRERQTEDETALTIFRRDAAAF